MPSRKLRYITQPNNTEALGNQDPPSRQYDTQFKNASGMNQSGEADIGTHIDTPSSYSSSSVFDQQKI